MIREFRALVIGATGAVGSALMRELLSAPACTGVTVVARRPINIFDGAAGREKLTVKVIDLDNIERECSALPQHDTAFCTMGIGQPRKTTREEFRRVDVDYAGAFARGARAGGARHISLLTAVGANPNSRTWYLKAKGDAERVVAAAGIARTSFFRPSLLVTKNIRYGMQDRLTQAIFPIISFVLPSRFHEIRVEDLGRAMRINAERSAPGSAGVEVLEYRECAELAGL